jgi:hypothetical protein
MKTKEDTLAVLKQFDNPMGRRLTHLFTNEDQEKVPDCDDYAIAAQLVLTSGYACAGALSVESDGLFCVTQPGLTQNPIAKSAPPLPVLARHFFYIHVIETIIIVKAVKVTERPAIFMG